MMKGVEGYVVISILVIPMTLGGCLAISGDLVGSLTCGILAGIYFVVLGIACMVWELRGNK